MRRLCLLFCFFAFWTSYLRSSKNIYRPGTYILGKNRKCSPMKKKHTGAPAVGIRCNIPPQTTMSEDFRLTPFQPETLDWGKTSLEANMGRGLWTLKRLRSLVTQIVFSAKKCCLYRGTYHCGIFYDQPSPKANGKVICNSGGHRKRSCLI